MKPSDRRAAAASYRRYVIAYSLFILVRCYFMYMDPVRPMRPGAAVMWVVLAFLVILMMFLRYLHPQFGLTILAIISVELIFRETRIKSLLFIEAALAVFLTVFAFRNKKVPT